ncbi:MAG TPA: YncE family protein [Terriglobales bacterium]|nr:YncE family protein [Terriglobales bacterium]
MKFLRKVGFLAVPALLWMAQLGCGDYYRPVANPVVSPGGQPQNAHFAWVVNFNPNGPGSTTEIDVSGDSNLAVNTMGAGSIAEAFPPSSLALFVANRDNDTVSEYLPTLAGPITTISLLAGSHPVSLNSSQVGNMFVLNSGPNSACPSGGSVSTIPLTSLAVSATACVGPAPFAMAQSSSNNVLYVLNQDGSVSVVNAGAVSTITSLMGQSPAAITTTTNGAYILIVTQGDGANPPALNIVAAGMATVAASVPVGMHPTFATVDPTLNRLYVANTGDNTVSVFDASNVNPANMPPIPQLATVPVGTSPIGVTALTDGSRFYVANSASNDVTVVSANSFSPLGTIPLPAGANPVFIASDPTASKVYVADQGTSQTTIIQTSNNAIGGNITAPPQQSGCTSSCALQQPMMVVTQ